MAKRELTDEEIEAAAERGLAVQPHAVAAHYDGGSRRVVVELHNGCLFAFPAELAEGLRGASAEELADVRVMPGGGALQWDRLDAGVTVEGLLAGIFGTRGWMQVLAAEMGRRGGSATSEAKAAAARANGRRGGRPRKRVDGAGTVYGSGTGRRATLQVRETAQPEPAADEPDGDA